VLVFLFGTFCSLGRFVDVLCLGHFVIGALCSLRRFEASVLYLGPLSLGPFLACDFLELGCHNLM
jgi:hypothetical protein